MFALYKLIVDHMFALEKNLFTILGASTHQSTCAFHLFVCVEALCPSHHFSFISCIPGEIMRDRKNEASAERL